MTRRVVLLGSVLGVLAASSAGIHASSVPAFPGAEGFGSHTVGGRGGQVIEVTNLNDSGPGSLRAAINASGPRIVVFRVGGTISLDSVLDIDDPFITIAGQTAPGDGILLRNGSNTESVIDVVTNDVVIRHLRLRPGPGGDGDCFSLNRAVAHNVVIDHCSCSWAVDENLSTHLDAHDITVQWSIFSEALDCSTHPDGCHSKGLLFGSAGGHSMTAHHNLFAHNLERNPRLQADGVLDIVNNVIYNPGFDGGWAPMHVKSKVAEVSVRTNVVGNYYKPGSDSGAAPYLVSASDTHQIYLEGNHVPNDVIRDSDQGSVVATSHPAAPITTTSAQEAYAQVLADAGANLGLNCDGTAYERRDTVDARVVSDVQQGTGSHIDDPSEVGGYPPVANGAPCDDSDHDGMPDVWESANGLNPNDASDGPADPDGDGYTNVEDYLNGNTPGEAPLNPPTNFHRTDKLPV